MAEILADFVKQFSRFPYDSRNHFDKNQNVVQIILRYWTIVHHNSMDNIGCSSKTECNKKVFLTDDHCNIISTFYVKTEGWCSFKSKNVQLFKVNDIL